MGLLSCLGLQLLPVQDDHTNQSSATSTEERLPLSQNQGQVTCEARSLPQPQNPQLPAGARPRMILSELQARPNVALLASVSEVATVSASLSRLFNLAYVQVGGGLSCL